MDLYKTDPEFMERFEHFAFDEVPNDKGNVLDSSTRYLAILATLIGAQGIDAYEVMLPKALDAGLDPVAIKEMVYQSVDYVGMAKMWPFLIKTNDIFSQRSIVLPLTSQATTTMEDRLEKGIEVQSKIFGEGMKEAWKTGTIQHWLADNCFGDYYTRHGLTLAMREMITFCFLLAHGGCEPQLIAHAKGNMAMGNDAPFLRNVVLQCVPYVGYPRSLNALTCIQKAEG